MIEEGKFYTENCLATMGRMPDELLDLTVTSPPYDGLRKYNGYSFEFEKIAAELYRVTSRGGVLVWVVSDQTKNGTESGTSFRQALFFMSLGFNLHDTMIYEKNSITMNHNRYEQDFEYMFILSKGKPKTFNPIRVPCVYYGKDGDRTGQVYAKHEEDAKRIPSGKKRSEIRQDKIKGNIWKYNVGFGHSTKDNVAFNHPAIFPEQLAYDHVISWSNEGDLVFDPFTGSGTVPKVCHLLNRRWIASDISGKYIDGIAVPRMDQFKGQLF